MIKALCILLLTCFVLVGIDTPSNADVDRIKGVCWVGGDSVDVHNFKPLLNNHIEWISQTPFGWQRTVDDPVVHFRSDRIFWGEREAGIRHTTRLATQHGIKTILKPHIWLLESTHGWRADIAMKSSSDWDAWFKSYEEFILHFAQIACDEEIEILCIGTELHQPAVDYPDRWRSLIHKVRQVYPGKLTYAANFYKEYEEITWWDELDYIGIQAYFPLSDNHSPSLEDLIDGWSDHLAEMERVHRRFNRPVLITELGYRNDDLAASEPWLWPQQVGETVRTNNDALQARCYEAFFESCWSEDWIAGVFFWKWFHSTWRHESLDEYFGQRNERRKSRMSESQWKAYRNMSYFTPQGREAQNVLKKYYSE